MRIVLLGLLMIGIVSCNQKTESIPYAVVSGKIGNTRSEKITVKVFDKKNDFRKQNEDLKEIRLAEDGTFTDTIFDPGDGYFLFEYQGESAMLYLMDGYNIYFNADAIDIDSSLVFTGDGSAPNNYLAHKNRLRGQYIESYILDEAEYVARIDSFSTQKLNFLKEIEDADDEFIKSEELNIKCKELWAYWIYQGYHRSFIENPDFIVSDSFPLGELYPKQIKKLDYHNDEYFRLSADYRALITRDYANQAVVIQKEKEISFSKALMEVVKTGDMSKRVSNHLLRALSSNFDVSKLDLSHYLYNEIMELSTDTAFKAWLPELFEETMKLAKGRSSPKFANYENHKGGITSLADFKGKYVYIDFWATWCGPCLKEVPFLNKVEIQYHGKNIVFVSISTDKARDHDKWRQMVTDKNMGGIQLLADKGAYSQFYSDYGITSIPRFILIDPEGKIVSANAPRPSDPKLIELFDELGL